MFETMEMGVLVVTHVERATGLRRALPRCCGPEPGELRCMISFEHQEQAC
jgi:hypothetical protein